MFRKMRGYVGCGLALVALVMIAMGVLFPAGREAFIPMSSALAMSGRRIYFMMQENSQRHETGEAWVSPASCSNSVEFITRLYTLLSSNKVLACQVEPVDCVWNVAIDCNHSRNSQFPLLLSANLDPKFLESEKSPLPIGKASGAPMSLLKDEGIVVVGANGESRVIRAKHCTVEEILNGSYERRQVEYLTPGGRVNVRLKRGGL